MINTKKLRRSNRVQTNQGIFYIWAIGKYDVMICPFLEENPFSISIDEIFPIELDEDVICKLGTFTLSKLFEYGWCYNDNNGFVIDKDLSIVLYLNGEYIKTNIKVKFVHDLQNKYLDFMNKELEINTNEIRIQIKHIIKRD